MMVAGEASGELHGAGVVRALRAASPACEIYGVGGDKMSSAGMELVYHIRELSVMGFWEVIRHLPVIRSVERTLDALLIAKRPDVLVLIDYPGFNLRFARLARAKGIRIVYYISPQVWAWNPGRVKKMRGLIDKMLVVFPFEADIYRKEGIDVEFVGHPLLEVLGEAQEKAAFCKRHGLDPGKPILALLPGSRTQEIERIFPRMLGAAARLSDEFGVQPVVGVSSVLELDYLREFLRKGSNVMLVRDVTHDLMANADAALVTSGTATLETGWYRTPMVVVYRTSLATYLLGRMLVKIDMIGLVNIVAGEKVVPELIQGDATAERIAREAARFLGDRDHASQTAKRLEVVAQRLGSPGASRRVAERILALA